MKDDEWIFVAPYLRLMREDAGQRESALRDAFDGLRRVVKTGSQWRYMPGDLPPWAVVYQQARRWLAAGSFEAMAHDLREILRVAAGRDPTPSAAILDGRTLRPTPESGPRAGYDGNKKTRGSKVRIAVDTPGNLLALRVTPANEQERRQVFDLGKDVQAATGQTVALAYVDQGYTGEQPVADAGAHGMTLEVVKHTEAKKGVVLLPRRWVVERTFAWMARFRRLARDHERLTCTLAGWHWVGVVGLMPQRLSALPGIGS